MTGDHVGFIVAAYAITFVAVGAMIVAILLDHRALTKVLSRMRQTSSEESGPLDR